MEANEETSDASRSYLDWAAAAKSEIQRGMKAQKAHQRIMDDKLGRGPATTRKRKAMQESAPTTELKARATQDKETAAAARVSKARRRGWEAQGTVDLCTVRTICWNPHPNIPILVVIVLGRDPTLQYYAIGWNGTHCQSVADLFLRFSDGNPTKLVTAPIHPKAWPWWTIVKSTTVYRDLYALADKNSWTRRLQLFLLCY
jgi:hypothetical protein